MLPRLVTLDSILILHGRWSIQLLAMQSLVPVPSYISALDLTLTRTNCVTTLDGAPRVITCVLTPTSGISDTSVILLLIEQ